MIRHKDIFGNALRTTFVKDEGLEEHTIVFAWLEFLCPVIRTILSASSKRAIGRKGQNHCPHLSAPPVSRGTPRSFFLPGISRDYHIFVGDLVAINLISLSRLRAALRATGVRGRSDGEDARGEKRDRGGRADSIL